MKLHLTLEECDKMAHESGFTRIDWQENIGMVSYKQNGIRINIYLTRMTVNTCLKHPKKGKTSLYRRNVSKSELEIIFKNPRKHTGKGYYTTK